VKREWFAARGCWASTFALLALLFGCGREIPLPKLAPSDVIVAFGDSLTAGTGADAPVDAYPAVLGRLIGREVINSGVPGETSAEGLRRLPAVLAKHRPRLVLLCLGGNDTLQRVNPKQTADNLKAMVQMAKAHGAAVVLIGVPARNLFGGVPTITPEIATALDLPYEGEVMYECTGTRAQIGPCPREQRGLPPDRRARGRVVEGRRCRLGS